MALKAPAVLPMIRELMQLEEPGWNAALNAIPAWHPRNEGEPDPPAADPPSGDPPAADPPAPDPAPPAGEPEVFDRDYVANLRKENAKYRTRAKRADELEAELEAQRQAELTELEREKAAREKAEKDAETLRHEALRAKIARKHGLDDELTEFVVGEDEAAMEAKAELLAKKTASTPKVPSIPGGSQGGGKDGAAMTAAQAVELMRTNPDEFNRMFEAGKIPPSALVKPKK